MNSKSSEEVTREINRTHKKHKHWLKTVTSDHDKAFSMHKVVSEKVDVARILQDLTPARIKEQLKTALVLSQGSFQRKRILPL